MSLVSKYVELRKKAMAGIHPVLGISRKSAFWILLIILVMPSGFFVLMSYLQLGEILNAIENPQPLENRGVSLDDVPSGTDPAIFEVWTRGTLELDTILLRHERSQTLLAARTWLRFMSLILWRNSDCHWGGVYFRAHNGPKGRS